MRLSNGALTLQEDAVHYRPVQVWQIVLKSDLLTESKVIHHIEDDSDYVRDSDDHSSSAFTGPSVINDLLINLKRLFVYIKS